MAISVPAWAKRFRNRRVDPFTRASGDGLDILMPPPYDMSEDIRTVLRDEVDALVERLLPNAVDAYSRGVLDDWIDTRADQIVARLDSERDERQAVGEALVGLAREQVARRKVCYGADVTRLQQAQEALEVARQELTGRRGIGPFAPPPASLEDRPLRSTLGRIDLAPDWDPVDHRSTTTDASPPEDAPFVLIPRQNAQPTAPMGADGDALDPTPEVRLTTRPNEENGHGSPPRAMTESPSRTRRGPADR